MITRHYVMRTYSHTDRQQLWKVMSRGFAIKADAEQWKGFEESRSTNPKHKFFIVSKEDEN